MTDYEYGRILNKFHKLSDRHIIVAETDMPYSDVLKVVALSDKIRKAGNELVGLMRRNHDQLMRTKRYRKLLSLYGSILRVRKYIFGGDEAYLVRYFCLLLFVMLWKICIFATLK